MQGVRGPRPRGFTLGGLRHLDQHEFPQKPLRGICLEVAGDTVDVLGVRRLVSHEVVLDYGKEEPGRQRLNVVPWPY